MRRFPSAWELRVSGMRARLRIGLIPGVVMLAITLLVVPRHGQTQQADLSQQLQLFNSMTPEQQQAIMQRLGGQGGMGGMGGMGGLSGLSGLGGSLGGISGLTG